MTKLSSIYCVYAIQAGAGLQAFIKVNDSTGCEKIERIGDDIYVYCKGFPVIVTPISNIKYYVPEIEKKAK